LSQPTFRFVCAECGKLHEGSPSFSFAAPFAWDTSLSEEPGCRLDSDLCVISGRDYFIRCILEIPIIDADEPFLWGVWVLQSEENWLAYDASFPNSPERVTFGYFSNSLPGYPETLSLHTQAHWRSDGERPWIELDAVDHPSA
jgi:hypothetical protein